MDKVQKKLVQGVFKLWETAQKDGGYFYIQNVPDVGLVTASSRVFIRLPRDCQHPFRADKEDVCIANLMKEFVTGTDSVTAFDTGETKTFNRNTVAKKIAYGTDGKSVFVAKSNYALAPTSASHLDLYNRNRLVRVYIEDEELPVMGITVYRALGDR